MNRSGFQISPPRLIFAFRIRDLPVLPEADAPAYTLRMTLRGLWSEL